MLDKVRRYIENNNMLDDGDTVVVGVSGGADSMCLLSVLLELGVNVYVVHINHMLRGKDAEEDMVYVENFCNSKGIKCFSFSYDVEKYAKENKLSCEEAGRKIRYEAFYNVMKENNCAKIAIAHNAGDNAETILHNLFRGTGIKGMTGISPKRGEIIRPLLCVEREEIERYLAERNITYRTDATNALDIYTRNRIRNTIVPYAKDNINSNVVGHINMAGQMLGEINEYITLEGDKMYEKCVVIKDNRAHIMTTEFNLLHTVIQKYIVRKALLNVSDSLKDITYNHIEMVLELFKNGVGKYVKLPYKIIARRTYDSVFIEKKLGNDKEYAGEEVFVNIDNYGEFIIGKNGGKLVVSNFSKDEWNQMENKYEEKIYTKWLDCDILERNLVIRTRKTGDYIIVDNKGSRKKIKDLFIDMKIPKEARDKVLLLANGEEILWIIGYRINYEYKVTEDTKDIIKLEYKE